MLKKYASFSSARQARRASPDSACPLFPASLACLAFKGRAKIRQSSFDILSLAIGFAVSL